MAPSSAEAPASYPNKNSNNKKNAKREGDDGKRETGFSFYPSDRAPRAFFFFLPASLRRKEACAEERGSESSILNNIWNWRQRWSDSYPEDW